MLLSEDLVFVTDAFHCTQISAHMPLCQTTDQRGKVSAQYLVLQPNCVYTKITQAIFAVAFFLFYFIRKT